MMKPTNFAIHLSETRRLFILRLLAELNEYRANSGSLFLGLQSSGYSLTRLEVKQELNWLAEQLLVTLELVDSVFIAELTERGQDVARGAIQWPGVARPNTKS